MPPTEFLPGTPYNQATFQDYNPGTDLYLDEELLSNKLGAFLDINGDGILDVVSKTGGNDWESYYSNSLSVYLGNSDGTFTSSSISVYGSTSPIGNAQFSQRVLSSYIDVNGDGFSDIMMYDLYCHGASELECVIDFRADLYLFTNNQDSTFTKHTLATNSSSWVGNTAKRLVADYNGDGRQDYIEVSGGHTPRYSNGDGSFSSGVELGQDFGASDLFIGDFNGDGCSDLLSKGTVNRIVQICNGVTDTFETDDWSNTAYQLTLGDYNGDGLTDVLVSHRSLAGSVQLSTGQGLSEATSFSVGTDWGKFSVNSGDLNGDGLSDIVLIAPGAGSGYYGSGTDHRVLLSTGTDLH